MKKHSFILIMVLFFYSAPGYCQCSLFYDGFESGTFSAPWAVGSGTYNISVPGISPAVGNYNLSLGSSTSNSFYEGAYAIFPFGQPTHISWWTRTNTTTAPNGYFVVGDANISGDNGILFTYFNTASELRFFAATGYNYPITANTWYHIEARNMNWTSRTMDIYIDNVLILPSWPFRSATATGVDRIHLCSLDAGTPEFDEIQISTSPFFLSVSQQNAFCFGDSSGSAAAITSGGAGSLSYMWSPGGATTASISGLPAGTYSCTVTDSVGCADTISIMITQPAEISSLIDTSLCAGESITIGSSSYFSTGNYSDVFIAANGCDSIVYTQLTVADSIVITTTLLNDTITATESGATYQWLDCDNGYSPLGGSIAQWYAPQAEGNFAVEITLGDCSDTSACVPFSMTGVSLHSQKQAFKVYPNPTQGMLIINGLAGNSWYELYDCHGALVKMSEIATTEAMIDLSQLPSGIYCLRIQCENEMQMTRIIKN